jgi:indole-3-glycerol phosphate synthase
MNILDKIVSDKRKLVEYQIKAVKNIELEKSKHFNRKALSFSKSIKEKSGIISEFKRQSPSKGIINNTANILEVVKTYEKAGASALSILSDKKYFGGENNDIITVRDYIDIPILRKDFIIDEYQIVEAKAIGADVILLIAAILSKEEVLQFAKFAKSLGMEVLLEIHNIAELSAINQFVDCVGVNNRNLKDFTIDINNSIFLSKKIPGNFVKVSESGINSINTINILKEHNFKGFLIGENFMKTDNPGQACNNFIRNLSKI